MIRKFRSCFHAKNRSHKRRTINIEPLEARQMLTGMPVISEFMASNSTELFDEDGESSDWIEIFNSGTSSVNLEDYALTDNATNTNKWEFPAVELESGGYLTVFASNKDRDDPESELHTNFRLSSGGEYLGLVAPDGTIMQEFSPEYPPQITDVSYGLGTDSVITNLVDVGAAGSAFVPSDGVFENDWQLPGFDDADWTSVTTAIGYETGGAELGLYGEFVDGLSPVAHWTFDESASIVAGDSSPNNISGISFSSSREESLIGRAVNLTKTNDDVRMGSNAANFSKLESTDELAIAVWVQKTATNIGDVVSLGDHYRVRLNPDGSVEFAFDNSGGADSWASVTTDPGIAGETVPVDGQWHHIVAQKTSTGLEIWIDGVKSSAELATTDPIDYTGLGTDLFIGRNGDTNTHNLNGKVDDVAIWDEALSEATVVSLFGGGDTPGGYTDTISSDVQADMFGNNSSVYLRVPFEVTDLSSINQLTLFMQYDDGFVAYINGTEAARGNAPGDVGLPVAFDTAAIESRADADAIEFSRIDVSSVLGGLQIGENILAIQGLNVAADNADFLLSTKLDAALVTLSTSMEGYMSNPTPGALNSTVSDELGPVIDNVEHSGQPADGEPIVVTAEVTETVNAVATVQLIYRVMFDEEVTHTMIDDGTGSDAVAGDGVFTAIIPGGVANPGEMIRYYVRAADTNMVQTREPLFADSNNSPEYYGTIIEDPENDTQLPILHRFIENTAAAETGSGTRGAIFYNGEFYDNVFIRIRGGTARAWPKKSYKIEFNDRHHFRYRADVPRVDEFNLNTTYTDKAYMRAILAYDTHTAAGSPASETFAMQVRQNGAFFSVAHFVEQPDRNFLRRVDLDADGSLYKGNASPTNGFIGSASSGAFEKKTRKDEDFSDLQDFIDGLALTGQDLENYLFDNVDLAAQVNFMAVNVIIQNIDATDKNFYIYRDTEGDGEWQMLPWDLDLIYGPNALNTDTIVFDEDGGPAHTSHPYLGTLDYPFHGRKNHLFDAIINNPRTNEMFLRRVRTLMDELLASADTPEEDRFVESRIDELVEILGPDVLLDQARWGGDAHFGSRTYTLEEAADRIKNEYLAPRRTHLFETHSIDAVIGEVITVLPEDAQKSAFVPTDDSLGLAWTQIGFDDNQWITGNLGVGYDEQTNFDDLLGLDLRSPNVPAELRIDTDGDGTNENDSVYVRVPFDVADPSDLDTLRLRMRYDDGFVAYINGVEVARDIAPDPVQWNSSATSNRFDLIGQFQVEINFAEFDDVLLVAGTNILAIHGLTDASGGFGTSRKMIISPELLNGFPTLSEPVGIPHDQVQNPTIEFGAFDANPVSGNQDEEYIEIVNPNDFAVDISNWQLVGGVEYTIQPGTVIPSGDKLYLTASLPAFRARESGPTGNSMLFAQGPYSGHLSNFSETIELLSASGTTVATLTTPSEPSAAQQFLRVSEVHYNPAGDDNTEFIELTNITPDAAAPALDLSGVVLTDGPSEPFSIPAGTTLSPNQYLVIVKDVTAFQAAYPDVDASTILGPFAGALANGGERIKIDDADGSTIVDFSFRDSDPWPERSDGVGATLELIDPSDTPIDQFGKHYRWRGSAAFGGSPGTASVDPVGVVINEVFSKSDDAAGGVDAIELYNASDSVIDVGGWALSDSAANLLKFQIPIGTSLAAGQYVVIDESHFNPTPANPREEDFALNGDEGDDVWLVIPDGNGGVATIVDDVHFGASSVGESFVRVPGGIIEFLEDNSGATVTTGRLYSSSRATLGCANAHPRTGDVVISEVNYNPGRPSSAALAIAPDLTSGDLEFVEIHNATLGTIDLTNWRVRGGVDYDFTDPTTLSARETIVLVDFNPQNSANKLAAFRTHFGMSLDVRVLGGFSGQLSNTNDAVRLERPGSPPADDPLFVPRIVDDEIRYDDLLPWSTLADGGGNSLQRNAPTFYGAAASSWMAALPTPGTANFAGSILGDLSGNLVVDANDINMVFDTINADKRTAYVDLDGNSIIDQADVDFLLSSVLGTVRGDANLDGKVDAMDLNQVGLNWRMTGCVTWEDGDFTGDGLVAAGDLNAIGVNWLHGVSPEAPPLRAPRAPLGAMEHPPKAAVDPVLAVDLFFAAADNSLPKTAAAEELSIDIMQASEQSVHSKEHRAYGHLRGRNYTATLATGKSVGAVNPAYIDGLFASLSADIRFSRIL